MTERRLLAVSAHPDDESFAAGGTLALLARSGVDVLVVTATRGELGFPPDGSISDGEELARVRENELRAACEILGARPPVVLVSHNPDVLFEAARRDVALVLSGHTHAGQIRIPGWPVLVRQSRYRLDEGRYRARATDLVVSRGLGAVGIPLRIACAPEAVLLELACRSGARP